MTIDLNSSPWRMAGASVRGTSHQKSGLPCQDAQGFRILQDESGPVLLIALADGAGSAAHSDQGARRAVEVALETLSAAFDPQAAEQMALEELELVSLAEPVPPETSGGAAEIFIYEAQLSETGEIQTSESHMDVEDQPEPVDVEKLDEGEIAAPVSDANNELESFILQAFGRARRALCQMADSEDIPLRDLSSTLTCAVLRPDCLIVGQLGDGAVVAQAQPGEGEEQEGELFAVTTPQRGEYANETYFLTQVGVLDKVQLHTIRRPIKALAAMSDGLLRLAMKMSSNEPHPPFFKPLFTFAATAEDPGAAAIQLEAFLNSDRVNARTDDDKSLVLVVHV